MKILFTGGGTGGHVFPIIAIVREIKKKYPQDIRLLYVGPKSEFVSLFLSQEEIKIKTVLAGKIRRYSDPIAILLNILDFFKLFLGTLQAFFWVFVENPDLIFSAGGYGSIPTIISGKILQVPIFLHEQNIIPGLANRMLAKFALEIFVSFPKTEYLKPQKITLVGNPIRKEILEGSKEKARTLFTLTGEKPVLLVIGGSQGAQRINDLLLLILPEVLEEFEVLHQTGTKNFKQVQAEAKVVMKKESGRYYHPFPFFREHELREALAVADIIVSRAGAGHIFEIAACGKPSILIPLSEAAQDHQVENAYAFSQNEASIIIEEANLTPHFFLEKLKLLIARPDLLEKMGQKAREFSKPKAAEIIANYLLEYLEM